MLSFFIHTSFDKLQLYHLCSGGNVLIIWVIIGLKYLRGIDVGGQPVELFPGLNFPEKDWRRTWAAGRTWPGELHALATANSEDIIEDII